MTMNCVRRPNPEPTSSQVRNPETPGNVGLIHLAACLGSIVAVIAAVNLINWLA